MRSGVRSYIGTGVHVAIGRNPPLLNEVKRLYLDHAATTPVLPEASAAAAAALQSWANPSSPHAEGRNARSALEAARRTVADRLGWRHDVIFAGASEAIAIVASRAKVGRRIVGPTEHEAVTAAMGEDAELLAVDGNGLIRLSDLEDKLAAEPALVAIQQVNNETGVIQQLDRIYELVQASSSLLLADCAQGAGKIPLPDADFIAISSHKFGGPPGIGGLLVKDLATLQPSGGQERGYRRGTENLPGAAGMAAALQSGAFADAKTRVKQLRAKLEADLLADGAIVIAEGAERSPFIGAYAMPGLSSASQLVQFDLAGIAVSAGSACSSGSMKPSRVLEAMGVSPEIAACVIRVSFGPATREGDVERFVREWRTIKARASKAAA